MGHPFFLALGLGFVSTFSLLAEDSMVCETIKDNHEVSLHSCTSDNNWEEMAVKISTRRQKKRLLPSISRFAWQKPVGQKRVVKRLIQPRICKSYQGGCRQCSCLRDSVYLNILWESLEVKSHRRIGSSLDDPLRWVGDVAERALDQALDHEISARYSENYDQYKDWEKQLKGIHDYSAFLGKESYANTDCKIDLEWDLTGIALMEKYDRPGPEYYVKLRNAAYKRHSEKLEDIERTITGARKYLKIIYARCRAKHPCLRSIYDNGFVHHVSGDHSRSVMHMTEYAELAHEFGETEPVTLDNYLLRGEAFLMAMEYEKAVELLTEAIQQYPDRKELYEQRIVAYFELGRYEEATQDFVSHNFGEELHPDPAKTTLAKSFLKGASQGVFEGIKEYPLSMLYSLRGAGQMLWATASDPMSVPGAIIMNLQNTIAILQQGDVKAILGQFAPELCEVVTNWDTMGEEIKWEKLGYAFGKYGFEILCNLGNRKLLEAFQSLRSKNTLCNVKANVFSAEKKISHTAEELAAKRKAYFESSKICPDKQGKHIEGHNSYRSLPPDKAKTYSILTDNDPEGLLRKHAGKGSPFGGKTDHPWEVGYREDVNFGKVIGIWKSQEGNESKPTTWGRIHYDKEGFAHIAPIRPRES